MWLGLEFDRENEFKSPYVSPGHFVFKSLASSATFRRKDSEPM